MTVLPTIVLAGALGVSVYVIVDGLSRVPGVRVVLSVLFKED